MQVLFNSGQRWLCYLPAVAIAGDFLFWGTIHQILLTSIVNKCGQILPGLRTLWLISLIFHFSFFFFALQLSAEVIFFYKLPTVIIASHPSYNVYVIKKKKKNHLVTIIFLMLLCRDVCFEWKKPTTRIIKPFRQNTASHLTLEVFTPLF